MLYQTRSLFDLIFKNGVFHSQKNIDAYCIGHLRYLTTKVCGIVREELRILVW